MLKMKLQTMSTAHIHKIKPRVAKRMLDFVFGSMLTLILLPIITLLILFSYLFQGSPVFFSQTRVGLGGRNFKLFKFRTMVNNAESLGSKVTVGGDMRITPWGNILRRCKFDELPQLWNVIRGDMSLVGPRPEVPEYVKLYDEQQQRVLTVRPGITDVASLKYYNESEQLAKVDDPKRFYIEQIMPDKIRMNLEYIDNASTLQDLVVISKTALRVLKIFS